MTARLFTTYYEPRNEARRQELDLCLQMNCQAFDSVTILTEGPGRPAWFNGLGDNWGIRPQYANAILSASHAGDGVVVIANSDIIIPQSSLEQIDCNLRPNEAYALTRWDITENGIRLFDRVHSQDVWAFRGPPKPNIGGDYFFGVPGCDNRFAYELQAAGYEVLNPSRDIRTYHLHLSGYRPGNKPENRVPGPYLFVKPHHLGEKPQYSTPFRISKRASQV